MLTLSEQIVCTGKKALNLAIPACFDLNKLPENGFLFTENRWLLKDHLCKIGRLRRKERI